MWTAGEAKLFIDGQLQSALKIDSSEVAVSGLPLIIGGDPSEYCRVGEHFAGVIEAVRVSRSCPPVDGFEPPQVLTKTEATECLIDLRYDDGGYAYDRSGNGNHAILVNVEPVPAE